MTRFSIKTENINVDFRFDIRRMTYFCNNKLIMSCFEKPTPHWRGYGQFKIYFSNRISSAKVAKGLFQQIFVRKKKVIFFCIWSVFLFLSLCVYFILTICVRIHVVLMKVFYEPAISRILYWSMCHPRRRAQINFTCTVSNDVKSDTLLSIQI